MERLDRIILTTGHFIDVHRFYDKRFHEVRYSLWIMGVKGGSIGSISLRERDMIHLSEELLARTKDGKSEHA